MGCFIAVAILAAVYVPSMFAGEHTSKSLRLSAMKGQNIGSVSLMQNKKSGSSGSSCWKVFMDSINLAWLQLGSVKVDAEKKITAKVTDPINSIQDKISVETKLDASVSQTHQGNRCINISLCLPSLDSALRRIA